MPRRRPNAQLRRREHLTEAEVKRLMEAAKGNRWGLRDNAMILVAYRHGLRSSELVDLRWDQVDFETATLHVRRVKQGTPSTHPILGDELRALRRLQRDQAPKSPFVLSDKKRERQWKNGFHTDADSARHRIKRMTENHLAANHQHLSETKDQTVTHRIAQETSSSPLWGSFFVGD
jgi:integrase